MKPVAEWPFFVQFASVVTLAGTVGLALANIQTIAESDFQPIALKYQVEGQLGAINTNLGVINRKLTKAEFDALEKKLSDLRIQRIQLTDMVQREADQTEKEKKLIRLDSVEQDIRFGDERYVQLRCEIESWTSPRRC